MAESPPADSVWDPLLYQNKHAFVWEMAADLIDLLSPQPGERILDIGCGAGHLSAQIASRGAAVVGVDLSDPMIAQARQNFPPDKFPSLLFEVADAKELSFEHPFDAVFSNAALHWVKPASAAAFRMFHCLRPAGRLVVEFGGYGNVAHLISAMHAAAARFGWHFGNEVNPWYFPTIGEYAKLLESTGFDVTHAVLFDRPAPLEGPDGLLNWVKMFGQRFINAIPPNRQATFLADTHAAARDTLYRDGRWIADYRRLRIVARRPECA